MADIFDFKDPADNPPPPVLPTGGEYVWLWRYTDGYDEHWGTHHATTAAEAKAYVWRRLVCCSIAESFDDGELVVWPSEHFMIAGGYL